MCLPTPPAYFLTLRLSPNKPRRVLAAIGTPTDAIRGSCVLAYWKHTSEPAFTQIASYSMGVEPVVGLFARLTTEQVAADDSRRNSICEHLSLTVYASPSMSEDSVVEHLVVQAVGHVVTVELCDELDEFKTTFVTSPQRSPLRLLQRAIQHLLWNGETRPAPQDLADVQTHHLSFAEMMLAEHIPHYARRRFSRYVGEALERQQSVPPQELWQGFITSLMPRSA